jgi:hypothetical protein
VPLNDLTLLGGVAEVSSLADLESPLTVSQRAFDAARPRRLFYPGLPRAKRITERLKLPWRDVLEIAHAPEDKQTRLLAARRKEPDAKWVTPENAASALAVAATRLKVASLTQDEYRRERGKMLAHDARQWMHGGALRMPTEHQVRHVLGSWDAALRAAGLQDTTQRQRKPGKPRTTWTHGLCVAAVARYIADAGRHSTSTGYKDWCSQQKKPAPSLDTLSKFGGWPVVHGEALGTLPEQDFRIGHQPQAKPRP